MIINILWRVTINIIRSCLNTVTILHNSLLFLCILFLSLYWRFSDSTWLNKIYLTISSCINIILISSEFLLTIISWILQYSLSSTSIPFIIFLKLRNHHLNLFLWFEIMCEIFNDIISIKTMKIFNKIFYFGNNEIIVLIFF